VNKNFSNPYGGIFTHFLVCGYTPGDRYRTTNNEMNNVAIRLVTATERQTMRRTTHFVGIVLVVADVNDRPGVGPPQPAPHQTVISVSKLFYNSILPINSLSHTHSSVGL